MTIMTILNGMNLIPITDALDEQVVYDGLYLKDGTRIRVKKIYVDGGEYWGKIPCSKIDFVIEKAQDYPNARVAYHNLDIGKGCWCRMKNIMVEVE